MNEIPALIRVLSYLSILTVGGGHGGLPGDEDPDRRASLAQLRAVDTLV